MHKHWNSSPLYHPTWGIKVITEVKMPFQHWRLIFNSDSLALKLWYIPLPRDNHFQLLVFLRCDFSSNNGFDARIQILDI
jgi:hypothetical protein